MPATFLSPTMENISTHSSKIRVPKLEGSLMAELKTKKLKDQHKFI